MRKLATIILASLSTAACTAMDGGYPVAGMPAGEVTGSIIAEPMGVSYEALDATGYPDPSSGYCYIRGPGGEILYDANRPAMGRC